MQGFHKLTQGIRTEETAHPEVDPLEDFTAVNHEKKKWHHRIAKLLVKMLLKGRKGIL